VLKSLGEFTASLNTHLQSGIRALQASQDNDWRQKTFQRRLDNVDVMVSGLESLKDSITFAYHFASNPDWAADDSARQEWANLGVYFGKTYLRIRIVDPQKVQNVKALLSQGPSGVKKVFLDALSPLNALAEKIGIQVQAINGTLDSNRPLATQQIKALVNTVVSEGQQ
jgi:hypothetical protein